MPQQLRLAYVNLKDDLEELKVYKGLVEEVRPVLWHALDVIGREGGRTRRTKATRRRSLKG